jgi:hypothetical protein
MALVGGEAKGALVAVAVILAASNLFQVPRQRLRVEPLEFSRQAGSATFEAGIQAWKSGFRIAPFIGGNCPRGSPDAIP